MYITNRKKKTDVQVSCTRGVTLAETIVALSLGTLIVLGSTQVIIEGLRHVHGVRAEALLTSDAGYMVQVLRSDLWEASDVTVHASDPSGMDVIHGSDTVAYTVSDGQLFRNGIPITHDTVTVTSLAYTRIGQSVRIAFTLWSGPRTDRTFIGQTAFSFRT